ncbi:MAG: rhodanese-like domain-containing protein [Pseudomonadota bacterium]|nr:rhodanese-like domain-containing protein [Pseudomonadota bacterium]
MRIPPAGRLWLLVAVCAWSGGSYSGLADVRPARSIPVANLLEPAELAAVLRSGTAPKPLVLQVGFRTLYDQAHIAGAEYVGAAGEDEGLRGLRDRVARLPKDSPIVLYCGCCPWSHCPNVGDAFAALQKLGFTRLKVLHVEDNFGHDWVEKAYPVTKGS